MSNEADKSASSLQKLDVRNSDEMPALWNCTLSGCMTWEKIVLVERMYRAKSALDGAEALQRAYSQLDEITTDLDNSGLSQQLSLFNNSLHELSAQPADRALREFAVLQGETLASNIRRTCESVLEDSDYLAISAGGIGADTEVVNQLVDLVDTPLDTLDGRIVRET